MIIIPRITFGKSYSFKDRAEKIRRCADRAVANDIYFRFNTVNGTIVSTKRGEDIIIQVMLDNGPFSYRSSWVIEDGYYPEFDEYNTYIGFVEDDIAFFISDAPRGIMIE